MNLEVPRASFEAPGQSVGSGSEPARSGPKIIDISLELDATKFRMRTYEGFTKDMQFDLEVIKDYPGGLGQIVRGAHMRLHAGTHVDAPSHMVQGGKQIHDLALDTFIGGAVVADVRHRGGKEGISADDLEKSVGRHVQRGDRVLLRTDINKEYDGSPEWMARAPYLSDEAIAWFRDRTVSIVGFDFYHGAKPPGADPKSSTSRKLHELGILTMPYLTNLAAITKPRVTLIALPLKMLNVEASPIRAVVLED
jgi:kynurenine formamidase